MKIELDSECSKETVSTAPGKWADMGIPHHGWVCIGIEDLGTAYMICEMCESAVIRYVHTMRHLSYVGKLSVGCICAGRLEGNPEPAKERERNLQNLMQRRARWLLRKWRVSHNGNDYLNVDGFNIVVYTNYGCYEARIRSRDPGKLHVYHTSKYATKDEAKLAAFDLLIAKKVK